MSSHRVAFLRVLLLCLLVTGCGKTGDRAVPKTEDPARAGLRLFWHEYGQATQLRTSGKPLAAARAYREALKRNPTHEDSLYYLAVCLMDTGSYREAVPVLEKLLARNPASRRGNFQLGIALSTPLPGAELDFARARMAFERNVEINREESGPFLRLGELELCLGHTQEARHYFDTAAGFQSPEGLFRAGFMRYLAGRYGDASQMFRKVLELNAREKAISGRGVQSEGDVSFRSGKLTPLERAGVESLLFLYWSSRRAGGYRPDVPAALRIDAPAPALAPFRFVVWKRGPTCRPDVASIRDMWDNSWVPLPPGTPARYLEPLSSGRPRVASSPASLQIAAGQELYPLGDFSHPILELREFDVDSDGRKDLVSLSWKRGLRILRATGAATYEDWTERAGLPVDDTDVFSMAVLDFDRDGKPDLLVCPYAPYVDVLADLAGGRGTAGRPALRLFRNVGGGKFSQVRVTGLDGAHGVVRAVPADFDGDGFPDLLLANGGLDPFRLEPSIVLHNDGGRGFRLAAYLPAFDSPVRALGATAADFDGDGRIDVCLRTGDGPLFFRNVLGP